MTGPTLQQWAAMAVTLGDALMLADQLGDQVKTMQGKAIDLEKQIVGFERVKKELEEHKAQNKALQAQLAEARQKGGKKKKAQQVG